MPENRGDGRSKRVRDSPSINPHSAKGDSDDDNSPSGLSKRQKLNSSQADDYLSVQRDDLSHRSSLLANDAHSSPGSVRDPVPDTEEEVLEVGHFQEQLEEGDKSIPDCSDAPRQGLVMRLKLTDSSRKSARQGPRSRRQRLSKPARVSERLSAGCADELAEPQRRNRPSRSRRAPKRLLSSMDDGESGSEPASKPPGLRSVAAGAHPAATRARGRTITQKCAAVPRKLCGQVLSRTLRNKLNAMNPNERVPICFPDINKLVQGGSAPSRKKLESFISSRGAQVFDVHGAHKDWYSSNGNDDLQGEVDDGGGVDEDAVEEVDEAGDDVMEDIGNMDEVSEQGGRSESRKTVPSVMFLGRKISRQLRDELSNMDANERVSMWCNEKQRCIRGKAAPQRQNLDTFLKRKPQCEFFDIHGRHRDVGSTRRRDKSRESSRDCPARGVADSGDDPLLRAREVAQQAMVKTEEKIHMVLGSLRTGDPVSSLRMELEDEIDRAGGVAVVSKSMKDGVFLDAAAQFLSELESINVFDIFGCEEGKFSIGLPTFATIRVRLESGQFIGVADVWHEFCYMMAHLLENADDGTGVYYEAERILYTGGQVRKAFLREHAKSTSEEASLMRMQEICAKAAQLVERKGMSLTKAPVSVENDPDESTEALTMVEQQKSVVKHKSNYRDEKGHSYLGKRQSAKAISFALYRPGFDGQPRVNSADSVGGSRFDFESKCHLCSGEVDDYCSNALCCTNIVFGKCRRIFCFQCCTNKLGLTDDDFVSQRSEEEWFCFHCTGQCSRNRACMRESTSQDQSDTIFEVTEIILPCRSPSETVSVAVKLAECESNGQFEAYGEELRCAVDTRLGYKCFLLRRELQCTSYRAQVMVNGTAFCSFRFRVLPPKSQSTTTSGTSSIRIVEDALFDVGRPVFGGPLFPWEEFVCESEFPISGGGRFVRGAVRWKVKETTGPFTEKDLPKSLNGAHVHMCSRGECYDWRGSKRFPTVKWVAQPVLKVVDQGRQVRSLPLNIFEGPDSWSSLSANSSSLVSHPRISPGTGLEDFEISRNTANFSSMRKRQWGIVIGKSAIHGMGLFTVLGYRKGDFVIEYAGELIRNQVGDLREARYEAANLGVYLFNLNNGHVVDATMQSNRARFLNHSCDPNMISEIVRIKDRDLIVFIATRHIPPLAELTFDYQLPLQHMGREPCRCNGARCSGFMD